MFKQRRRTKSVRTGFTLVELLVVIAIIAILAAILFPTFAMVRERVKGTTCMSNLRQIGMAMVMYVNDKGEKMPPYIVGQSRCMADSCFERVPGLEPAETPGQRYSEEPYGSSKPAHYKTWMDCIHPYVKSMSMYTCPSHPQTYTDLSAVAWYGDPEYYDQVDNALYRTPSLGYNCMLSNIYSSPSGVPVALASFQNVSSKVFLVHDYGLYAHTQPGYYGYKSTDVFRATNLNHQLRMYPHSNAAPIVFCDGHVKTIPRQVMLKYTCGDQTKPSGYVGGDTIRGCGFWTPNLPVPF